MCKPEGKERSRLPSHSLSLKHATRGSVRYVTNRSCDAVPDKNHSRVRSQESGVRSRVTPVTSG